MIAEIPEHEHSSALATATAGDHSSIIHTKPSDINIDKVYIEKDGV